VARSAGVVEPSPHRVTPYRVTLHRVTPHRVTPHRVTLYRVTLHQTSPSATAPDHGDMTSVAPKFSRVLLSRITALGHAKLVG
jgi:hypothetical protein